jgi:hypothetical protein
VIRGGSVGNGVGVFGVVLVEFAHAEVTDAAKIEIRKARLKRAFKGKLDALW